MVTHKAPTADDWDDIAEWWLQSINDDPIYASDVHPLYADLVDGVNGRFLDLGCGNGQGMDHIAGPVVGVDLSQRLLVEARSVAPVIRGELPSLAYVRDSSFDHAGAVYLVELIADEHSFFSEVARVVRPGGTLSIVINHPVYTAPGSAPIADTDGEVLWRWGRYHDKGSSVEVVGDRTVRFHHRPTDALLTSASANGWNLERLYERPLSDEAITGKPGYLGQDQIPRLMGVRWRLQEGS